MGVRAARGGERGAGAREVMCIHYMTKDHLGKSIARCGSVPAGRVREGRLLGPRRSALFRPL